VSSIVDEVSLPVRWWCMSATTRARKHGARKHKQWTLRELKLLGSRPDAELAQLLHRSVSSIRTERWRNGIPQKDPKCPWWTKQEDKLLGAMPDEEVSRRLGRSVVGIRFRRRQLGILLQTPWIAKDERLLGTMPDQRLAKLLGRTRLAVTTRRILKRI
jgi:hypothetical protein